MGYSIISTIFFLFCNRASKRFTKNLYKAYFKTFCLCNLGEYMIHENHKEVIEEFRTNFKLITNISRLVHHLQKLLLRWPRLMLVKLNFLIFKVGPQERNTKYFIIKIFDIAIYKILKNVMWNCVRCFRHFLFRMNWTKLCQN